MIATQRKKHFLKMVAQQPVFVEYDQHLAEEGEVFVYSGDELPSQEVAVPAPQDAVIGEKIDLAPPTPRGKKPFWTTQGFKDAALENQFARVSDAELLEWTPDGELLS